jgi:uncharacterized protein YkwD
VVAAFALSSGACASGRAQARADVAAQSPRTGKPSGEPAHFYATAVAPALVTDPLAERIVAEIADTRRTRGYVSLIRDGRLDRVAGDIARTTGACRVPAADTVTFLRWHYGVVEPDTNLFLACGQDGSEASELTALQSRWTEASDPSVWRRMGVGVERVAGTWRAALIFQEKNLDLEPVPRALASQGRTTISGRIRNVFRLPEVLVTPPRGAVGRLATDVNDGRFSTWLECKSGDGTYQIEIGAQDDLGPRVLAIFPVYCGVAPPVTFVLAEDAPLTSLNVSATERAILELLDHDREANGLPSLVRDRRLEVAARRYSNEMVETGEVAHVSRRSGSIGDRVDAVGLSPQPTIIAENVCRAASAADAESGFMASPGHRNNILNREFTHVGIGVAFGHEEGSTVSIFVTQIFAGWAK